MVTSRDPDDGLFQSLQAYQDRLQTLRAIGDCNAPGTVAAAVYDGHSAARHLQSSEDIYAPLFVRDMPTLD
jgi:dimethylamine/trimethylamine dehydrogenase